MTRLPALSRLTHEKDALIRALWAQVRALTAQVQTLVTRVAELKAKLNVPPKTPDNSSLPPSQGKKPNRAAEAKRHGPRLGSLGRMGGGRPLAETPDGIVNAKPVRCAHCQTALGEVDQVLHGHYDKIDLPQVVPVVTRVERYAGHCRCYGSTALAPVPEKLKPGTPFSVGIVALAMYPRSVHAISYQRLLGELFGLAPSTRANAAGVSSTRSTPSWHCLLPVATASGYGGDTASSARTCYFLNHPERPADNGSERERRPTATYRKVTGGFRPT